MVTYLEHRSFGHIFDDHTNGLYLFVVIWFIHDLASILDCFLLWTKTSGDIIDVGNLSLSLLRVVETYGSTESNNPYAGVGSFHSRYHYFEGSSSVVSEKVYLR